MTGKVLDHYEVLDKLGEGGMGEVWRARDRRLHRMVALKILPSEVADDPARRVRFEQEARALGALNHPNIVSVYDIGQDQGRAYMASELVEGESLRAVLDRGPLPARKAIDIGTQVAEGMAAAHALGIVHRDLKPENVMVARNGQVKLLDFGLAKQTVITPSGDKTATMALSEPGTVLGTVGYMSPEQIRAEPVDARSDIFSFGCVLYEMLAGQRAFRAGSSIETMHAVLNAEPPELDAQQVRMPPALSTIVRRCLEKRPEQRFQSAADLAFALRSISGSSVSGIHGPVAVSGVRTKRWLWSLGAVLGALLLLSAGFLLRDRTLHREPAQFQRITFRKGYVEAARFTPDGRNVVYTASWDDGPSRVYLTVPGSSDSRDLNLPSDAELMAVSSREEIAFLTAPFGDYGTGTLEVGSISGGQMRPMLEGVLAADWAPDGSAMAVLRRVKGVNRLEYPVGTVLVDRIPWPLWMIRVSPDGARVVFASLVTGRRVGLTVVDRTGKQQFLGTVSGQNSTAENSWLSWNPKGDEIWYRSFNSGEPGTVYAIDLKNRRRLALVLPSRVWFHDISRDGQALLSTGSVQLGILGSGPGDAAERDLSCLDSGSLIGISEDGRVIVANITGEAGGWKGSVYLRKTDGSPAIRLGDGQAYKLSPDGKWVAGYVLNETGIRRWVVLPTGPGEAFDVKVPGLPEADVMGWLAGEQQYIVMAKPQRRWQCFAWDAQRGAIRPVCPEGIPDSRLIFVSPDRKQVLSGGPQGGWFAYPVEGGPPQEIHGIEAGEVPIGWRRDNQSVYVQPSRENDKTVPVSIVEIATGKRAPWKQIHPSQPVVEVHDLYITPDGSAYAYNFVTMQSNLYIEGGLQ